ncbi:hypothetical protein OTK49_03340 [Vibrio coralliirubri]|uniref:hypothetical protein n=1 Tax=Vibrio coralliirubri TaxID=1516159 RepID=UPI0022834DE3|nr:hypothetical protein [Vibrio coralliirubri]MCY9861551.1 hypothetical protein [Vibrio coralliirubri]
MVYSNPVDQIIYQLFSTRWVGESVTCSLQAMKKQLRKNLTDQVNGYWSGHTAYHIMIDGGFLEDAPHANGKPKMLTERGKLFMSESIPAASDQVEQTLSRNE